MSKEAVMAPGAGAAVAPPKKKGKIIILVLGLCLAVGAAGGGYWFSLRGKATAQGGDAPKKVAQKARIFATLDSFTVNLRATTTENFLQVGIVYEVASNAVAEAIKANMPLIRGKVLLLLSGKTAQDLGTPEGKAKLAAELVAVARYALQGAPGLGDMPLEEAISDAHFSSMIIQ